MVMANIERRLERLEDRLMPREIIGPYKNKGPFDEEGFRTVFKEFLSQYTPEQLEDFEKKFTEMVKGLERESTRAKNQEA